MEILVLLGMLACCVVTCCTGLALAKRHTLSATIATILGICGLVAIGFGLLPTVGRLTIVEQQHQSTSEALSREQGRSRQNELEVVGKIASVHRHLSQPAMGLTIPPPPPDLEAKQGYAQAVGMLASLEQASAKDEFDLVRAAFDAVPDELKRRGLSLDAARFREVDRAGKAGLIAAAIRDVGTAAPPACPGTGPRDVQQCNTKERLRERLQTAKSVSEPLYRIEKLDTDELVKNLKGHWYRVTLRSGRSEQLLTFNEEKKYYTLSEDTELAVRRSVASFWADVMAHLPASRRLYVRGRSDARILLGQLEEGYDYSTSWVKYHKGNEKTGFESKPEFRRLAKTNEDLPNWRAAYLRTLIPDTGILEGDPKSTPTGEVLLFVDWNDRQ